MHLRSFFCLPSAAEFDPSLLADRLIVAFHEPPTNLTRLSELAGVEVVSVRQSTVGYVLELGASFGPGYEFYPVLFTTVSVGSVS